MFRAAGKSAQSCRPLWRICIRISREILDPTRGRKLLWDFATVPPESSIKLPGTAVPVPTLYCQRTTIHPFAGNGPSSTKRVIPQNEDPPSCRTRTFTAVPVKKCTKDRTSTRLPDTARTKLIPPATKTHPVARHDRSSSKILLPQNENPSGRVLPVLSLYYRRAKINPVAGNGPSNTKLPIWFVLP